MIAAFLLLAAVFFQPAPRPHVTMTFDGGIFKSRTVVRTPMKTTYANNRWRSKRDPRVDRFSIDSETSAGEPSLNFGVFPRIGVTVYDRKDEDDPDRNPYMRFDLHTEYWPAAAGYRFDLLHVDVTVTKLEEVGGRIEGTFQGTYELCTLPENGGGNCTARAPLTITGSFSVVRIKDRVID